MQDNEQPLEGHSHSRRFLTFINNSASIYHLTMKNIIKSLIGALLLAATAFASPVTGSFDSTFHSAFIDKGVPSTRATLISAVGVGYESFGLELKTYAPTIASVRTFKTAFNRMDVTGSYVFKSTLGDVTVGNAFKHYYQPGKTGQGDHNQPFVRLSSKWIPVTLVARYDIATRNLNTEANAKLLSVPVGFATLVPSVYVGYSDIADQFPHSLKAVKRADRYYGGGLGLTRKIFGGTLAGGGYLNQADHGATNRTVFWTLSYSIKG